MLSKHQAEIFVSSIHTNTLLTHPGARVIATQPIYHVFYEAQSIWQVFYGAQCFQLVLYGAQPFWQVSFPDNLASLIWSPAILASLIPRQSSQSYRELSHSGKSHSQTMQLVLYGAQPFWQVSFPDNVASLIWSSAILASLIPRQCSQLYMELSHSGKYHSQTIQLVLYGAQPCWQISFPDNLASLIWSPAILASLIPRQSSCLIWSPAILASLIPRQSSQSYMESSHSSKSHTQLAKNQLSAELIGHKGSLFSIYAV